MHGVVVFFPLCFGRRHDLWAGQCGFLSLFALGLARGVGVYGLVIVLSGVVLRFLGVCTDANGVFLFIPFLGCATGVGLVGEVF
jgi:hypothetical protein